MRQKITLLKSYDRLPTDSLRSDQEGLSASSHDIVKLDPTVLAKDADQCSKRKNKPDSYVSESTKEIIEVKKSIEDNIEKNRVIAKANIQTKDSEISATSSNKADCTNLLSNFFEEKANEYIQEDNVVEANTCSDVATDAKMTIAMKLDTENGKGDRAIRVEVTSSGDQDEDLFVSVNSTESPECRRLQPPIFCSTTTKENNIENISTSNMELDKTGHEDSFDAILMKQALNGEENSSSHCINSSVNSSSSSVLGAGRKKDNEDNHEILHLYFLCK